MWSMPPHPTPEPHRHTLTHRSVCGEGIGEKKRVRNEGVQDGEGISNSGGRRRRKQTLASLGGEQMEPREGREEEERGRAGGRRGEAHNAMGHGGWTDSICSQLSVALVMDGETLRAREGGRRWEEKLGKGRRGWTKESFVPLL